MEKEAVSIEKDDINEGGKKEACPQRKSEARELLEKTHACYGDGLYCRENRFWKCYSLNVGDSQMPVNYIENVDFRVAIGALHAN